MNREQPAPADSLLIRSYLDGDRIAFDRLVVRYKDRVYNLCYRMMGDHEEANDCAQETFIRVYRALPRFRFEAAFSTWLYRIAVNTCKNTLSSRRFRFNRTTSSLDGQTNGGRENLKIAEDNPYPSPDGQLERREREELLQNAIRSLPAAQRSLVVLRDIQGHSYDEITAITGLNLGTVKSKLCRARGKLREKLKGSLEY
jgi:RNA polymerase sigma-70 factor (ECF subfamily)